MITSFNGHQYLLTTDKVLVHLESNTGFIADIHLGKSSHFRKSGIAIPSGIVYKDLDKLAHVIKKNGLKEVYFLGDLFHSEFNLEWKAFLLFLKEHPGIRFTLIKGNHDILSDTAYTNSSLEVVSEPFLWHSFILSHHPLTAKALSATPSLFNIAGHIHPGKLIKGKARSAIKLACYLERAQQLILPAFGRFTGLATANSKINLKYYLIGPGSVFVSP